MLGAKGLGCSGLRGLYYLKVLGLEGLRVEALRARLSRSKNHDCCFGLHTLGPTIQYFRFLPYAASKTARACVYIFIDIHICVYVGACVYMFRWEMCC